MVRGGSRDEQFHGARHGKHAQLHIHHRVGSQLRGFALQARQGGVPDLVVHLRELVNLAARQRAQHAGQASPDAERVGDVAHGKANRLIASIQVAVQIGTRGRGREQALRRELAVHRSALREKLVIAAQRSQFAHHPRDSCGAQASRIFLHAIDGRVPALRNQLREIAQLAPGQGLPKRRDGAADAERKHAVADGNLAGPVILLREAVELVARHARNRDAHEAPRLRTLEARLPVVQTERMPQSRDTSRREESLGPWLCFAGLSERTLEVLDTAQDRRRESRRSNDDGNGPHCTVRLYVTSSEIAGRRLVKWIVCEPAESGARRMK